MTPLTVIEGISASVAAACAYDLVSSLSSGTYTTSFDYRYLPISKPRLATIGLLAAAMFYLFLTYNPADPAPLPLFVFGAAAVIHGLIWYLDWRQQRRIGYRTPLDYGERDES